VVAAIGAEFRAHPRFRSERHSNTPEFKDNAEWEATFLDPEKNFILTRINTFLSGEFPDMDQEDLLESIQLWVTNLTPGRPSANGGPMVTHGNLPASLAIIPEPPVPYWQQAGLPGPYQVGLDGGVLCL
jgi:hypothetical protein